MLGTALIDGQRQLVVGNGAQMEAGRFAGSLDDWLHAGAPAEGLAGTGRTIEADELMAPVRPGKIVAVGLNYRDHVVEAKMDAPAEPLLFAKFPSTVVGPFDVIELPDVADSRTDWEVELAVVVGRTMRNVTAEAALDHVLGYTVVNDVSARAVQFGDGQWVRGKSFDTFCPMGPVIATTAEIGDPQRLKMRCWVTGQLMQDSDTSQMIFSVAEILAYCSRWFTLGPGDVVITGTPWGCGEFMSPQRSLAPGDVVETEIEGIGKLCNAVVAPTALSGAAREAAGSVS